LRLKELFLNLSRFLKLELAGPWTHYCSVDGRPSVQPPIDTRAPGVLIRAEAKKSSCPVKSRLNAGTIRAIWIGGLTGYRIQNPESRIQRVGDQQSRVFSPSRCPNGILTNGRRIGRQRERVASWNLQDRVLQCWAIRRKRSGFRDAPIAQHTRCHPGAAPASSTLRDNNFRTLARPEHCPHA
jgi:hypothetical protein